MLLKIKNSCYRFKIDLVTLQACEFTLKIIEINCI
jgi:hypothetical protein